MPLPAIIALFTAAFALIASPWLSGAVTIPWDAKAQFYPQLAFLARALANGVSPSWTPNVFAGWPQIADPQSLIFSPLHVVLALVSPRPSFWAADMVTFLALLIGGLALILFFRDRGWHPAGALIAALVFAFGGSAASRLQHTGQIMSMTYLPVALWLLARTLEHSSWRAGIAAGLVAGLIAIGRDQVALLTLYLLAGFVVAWWLSGPAPAARIRASVPPLAACAAATVLLAAIPMLLTLLLAADSNRPEMDYISAGRGSLHPAHLLMLAFADLYGAADPAVDFWGPPSYPWMHAFGHSGLFLAQNVGQIYAGAVPLVVILGLGLVRGLLWSREIRFFSIALALLLLYALGWYTPAFRVMYELVPGVSLFRRPADATFVLNAMIAIVAGYLVHRWVWDQIASPTKLQRGFAAVLAIALIGAAASLSLWAGMFKVAVVPILTGIAFTAAAIGVLALARRMESRSTAFAAALLAAFMAFDLSWNNGPNESTALPPSVYDALRPGTADQTVTLLRAKLAHTSGADRRDRVELTGIGYYWPNLSLVQGFEQVLGHNPLRLKDFARATGVGDTVAVPDQRTFAPLFPSYRSPFADLFGLRLIATGVPVEQIDSSLQPGDLEFIARTSDAYVYENPHALPRVMVVDRWQLADFAELIRSGWPDVDPTRTVLLERPPAGLPKAPGGRAGEARVVRYGNTEVLVEANAPTGGLLLLNDVWHPWWRAEVDGVPAEILRANVLFRAVVIGPGSHRVRFVFAPIAGALAQLRAKAVHIFARLDR